MEYMKLLVDFGVIQPPWLRDLTGQLGLAPSVAATAAFLRQHPNALALLRWRVEEAPLEAKLLHDMFGNILPLRQSDQMRYLRRQLRDIRMIWVITAESHPPPQSKELHRASEDLLNFSATFNRIQEIDPSLAVLAGPEEVEEKQDNPETDSYVAVQDVERIEDNLCEAADVAVWEGNIPAALRLLAEVRRFAEQNSGSVADPAARARYRSLSQRARQMSHDLIAAPVAYIARERSIAWQQDKLAGYDLLKKTIGFGMTIDVPSSGFDIKSPGGALEVIGLVPIFETTG